MKSAIHSTAAILAAFAALGALSVIAGCGGGSNSNPITVGGNITRQTDSLYSADAKSLAVLTANGPYLSAADAAQYDADLAAIRTREPAVVDIHVHPAYSLTQLVVTAPASQTLFEKGLTATDDPKLQALLEQYDLTGTHLLSSTQTSITYLLSFGESLNIPALVTVFENAGTSLTSVSPNSLIGGNDTVTVVKNSDNSRVYTFVHGSGDCPAGCISRETWTFTVSADGKQISEVASSTNQPTAK